MQLWNSAPYDVNPPSQVFVPCSETILWHQHVFATLKACAKFNNISFSRKIKLRVFVLVDINRGFILCLSLPWDN